MTTHPSPDDDPELGRRPRHEDPTAAPDSAAPISADAHPRIRSLLGGLPDPGPMPEDLVARIQARIADEALAQGTHEAEVVDLASRRRRLRVVGSVGAIAASAAVVGLLLTGGFGALSRDAGTAAIGLMSSGPSASGTGTAGATASGSAAATDPAAGGIGEVHIVVADKNVTEQGLDAEASALLTTASGTPLPGTAESPTIGPLGTEQGLRDCLGRAGISGQTVAAELASYEGTPAVILGVRGAGGDLHAAVLDRSCTPLAASHEIG